VFLDT
jgi:STE24 endopeptidase